MSDPYESYEQKAPHEDPAVQALIDNGWLGTWDGPITVADLEVTVRTVRNAGVAGEHLEKIIDAFATLESALSWYRETLARELIEQGVWSDVDAGATAVHNAIIAATLKGD